MAEDHEKLLTDLDVLQEMAADMSSYIRSDVLFWPMGRSDLPRLTLGGYLMRQHRLLALHHLLSDEDRQKLHAAEDAFEAATNEWTVRVEQRIGRELEARLRQWAEYLRDIRSDESAKTAAYYGNAVETRAMIAALLARLDTPPYRPDRHAADETALMDKQLRSRFQPGPFVWPDAWQSAYPQSTYWWLYGKPL